MQEGPSTEGPSCVRASFLGGVVGPSVGLGSARPPLFDEQRGVLTVAPILDKATPAFVSVTVASRVAGADNPLMRDPFFRRYFGIPELNMNRRV